MADTLSEQWVGVVGFFLIASLALEGVRWLNTRAPIARLIQSLVTGTSTVMAVFLIIEYVTLEIETVMHQIYGGLVLVAAILCIGLSMVCWRWYASNSDADATSEVAATTTPPRQEPPKVRQAPPASLDEQRERIRTQVQQEKAARQEGT